MVFHKGQWIVIDDPKRATMLGLGMPELRKVRFRSLGCWPVTAATESGAETLTEVVKETLQSSRSERNGRIGDEGTLEHQKRDGYF